MSLGPGTPRLDPLTSRVVPTAIHRSKPPPPKDWSDLPDLKPDPVRLRRGSSVRRLSLGGTQGTGPVMGRGLRLEPRGFFSFHVSSLCTCVFVCAPVRVRTGVNVTVCVHTCVSGFVFPSSQTPRLSRFPFPRRNRGRVVKTRGEVETTDRSSHPGPLPQRRRGRTGARTPLVGSGCPRGCRSGWAAHSKQGGQ